MPVRNALNLRCGMAFASQPCRMCALHHRCRGQTGRAGTELLMPPGAARRESGPDLTSLTQEAVRAAEGVLQDATRAVRSRVAKDNQTVDRLLDREQRATHALAWLATCGEAVRRLCAYAERMREAGRLGELGQMS